MMAGSRAILDTWRDIELFSPNAIPKLKDSAVSGKRVRDLTGPNDLSWLDLPAPPPGKVWRHQLYFGPFDIARMFEELDKVFPHTGERFDEKPRGESAIAVVIVDGQGQLVPTSAVLSSCAWGLGQARHGVRARAEDFSVASAAFVTALVQYDEDARRREGALRLSIAAKHLDALHQLAQNHAGLTASTLSRGIRVCSELVRDKKREDDDETESGDYLNSFYLDDLGRVSDAHRAGKVGAALQTLLDGPTTRQRVDLRAMNWGQTLRQVGAENLTRGRWPSEPEHAMALSQQLAVNLALGTTDLEHQSVTAVNGPPGTGKTTLLRDVLAELVVRRADAIAALGSPQEAFTKTFHHWNTQDGRRSSVRQLNPSLTGFEMLVASNNNLAVQNLSDNLPLRESVPGTPHAHHLPDLAQNLQVAYARKNPSYVKGEPWGLVAGRLGKADNRSAFRSALWFHKDPDSVEPLSLKAWLEARVDDPQTVDWASCVARYRESAARVDKLLAEALAAERRLTSIQPLQRRLAEAEDSLQEATTQLLLARDAHAHAEGSLQRAEQEWAQSRRNHEDHLKHRPGLLEWISTWGRASRRWAEVDAELASVLRERSHRFEQVQRTEVECRGTLAQWQRREQQMRHQLDAVRQELASLRTHVTTDAHRWGAAFPDGSWWNDEKRRHTVAPWQTTEMNAARNELFLAALTLHRDLLAHAAKNMLMNLGPAMDAVGRPPRQAGEEAVRSAWQYLFLAVPMVSTTFAAASRCLSGLGSEALGWLLVDEAGQASPAAAVGSVWRCSRAIVVGDPLQLKPINTLPQEAERGIQEFRGAPPWSLPTTTSVQQLADQTMPYGTWIGQGDARIWVGAPLIVHRRCENPMFGISNSIAYDGMMVQATRIKPCELEASRWIHVPASSGSGHAVPAHVERAVTEVRALMNAGVDPGEIIAIAPFKDLSTVLRQRLRAISPKITAGTVHTAQGREAMVVLLVLGGDKARPGARQWAAEDPNLLNVAVSRAKQRLIVVGDHDDWSRLPYFAEMARELPHTD